MRKISFVDGASSETVPTIGNLVASNLVQYANDAAFEAGEQGSPTTGNLYYNTTDNVIRYYNGTSWVSVNVAADVSYDNSTSGLTATDTQGAIDEVEARVDTNESDISTNAGNISTNAGNISTNAGNISTNASDITDLQNDKIDNTEKGAANGVATLDGGGKVPSSQLPDTLMDYLGTWNASTNTPTLADGSGSAGDVYDVQTAGTQDLGSGNITFAVGDWVVYNGTIWEKSSNSDAVTSVNDLQGIVVLDTDDINEGTTNEYYTNAKVDARIAAASVDDLSDVDTTTVAPTDGQALVWNNSNSEWEPGDVASNSKSVVSKSAAYTAVTTDEVILCNSSGGSFILTLYTAVGNTGRILEIKKTTLDTNVVTIDANSTETIDGTPTTTISTEGEAVTIISDGANWQILNRVIPNGYLTASSGVATPTTSGFLTDATGLTGNSVSLTPGSWVLKGLAQFSDSGGNPAFTDVSAYWAESDDSSTEPASSVGNRWFSQTRLGSGNFERMWLTMPEIRVNLTTTTTLYLNAFIGAASTYSFARVQVFIYAQKID